MRAKILILGLIFFFVFAYCTEYIENPYIPPEVENLESLPEYIYLEFEITTTIVLADETPFLTENDYCTFYLYIKDFLMFGVSIADESPSVSFSSIEEISVISTFQEQVMSIDCMMYTAGSSLEEEWFEDAQFMWTLKLVSITEGFIITPIEQQMTATGWAVKETKSISFTLTKE